LQASVSGRAVTLTWRPKTSAGGPAFYHVYRSAASGQDFACDTSTRVQRCRLAMQDLGTTKSTSFTDRPGKGDWRYRIGVAANWLDNPLYGDVYVFSSSVGARVGR
ncbi:MAG: hypothetical protein ACRDLK_05870, partial [Gaiellaceae bacterium]